MDKFAAAVKDVVGIFSCDFCHAALRYQLLQDTKLVLSFLVAHKPNFYHRMHPMDCFLPCVSLNCFRFTGTAKIP